MCLKPLGFGHRYMAVNTQAPLSPTFWSYEILFVLDTFHEQEFYFFIFCTRSLLLHMGFLQLKRARLLSLLVHRLLIMVASLVHGAQALGSMGSVIVVEGLSCSWACGNFPQGSKPPPLIGRRFLTPRPPREALQELFTRISWHLLKLIGLI